MEIPVITPIFGAVIGWMYEHLCFQNYMFTLVLFALFIKLLLFPFGIKQQKNTLKQAKLRPMEMAIRKKYAGRNDRATQEKLNNELMQLYQQENFNPASGCLPLLIQMPILFGLYSVIVNPLRYISELSQPVVKILTDVFGTGSSYDINVIKAITDMGEAAKPAVLSQINAQLAAQDITNITASDIFAQIADLQHHFSVAGIDLTVKPSFAFNLYLLVPILTFVFAFFSTKIIRKFSYQPAGAAQTQSSMAMMDWTMPLFSVWISFSVPSAIAIYWILQNILSAGQQILLHKMFPIPKVTDEEIKEAELKLKGKANAKKKDMPLAEPDANSPIFEKVPEDLPEQAEIPSVGKAPLGLTKKIKKHLHETKKPLKARRKI
mgnify:CR=1 FL=1